ncbi:MAG: response regulator [Bacillota bacterium]
MRKKVVIIDDTMFMRMTLKNILQQFGIEIAGEGSNGLEAVTLYKRLKPDLITMDITMPKKDGLEAVKEIIEYDQEAVIIMVSAMGQKERVIDAVSAGAKDFIVKPFKRERIAEALERIGFIEEENSETEEILGEDSTASEETSEKDNPKDKDNNHQINQ